MLELKDLDHYYGGIHALKGISLTVAEGEVVALIGSNGAGKTTTLRCISGLLAPSSGRISFRSVDISRKPAHAISRMGIAHVLEGRHLFPHLTVRENLEMGAYRLKGGRAAAGDLDEISGMFPVLRERMRQKAGTLSGGEQQMLAIGRALMSRPSLLLMDEPSVGLAPMIVKQIFSVIEDIARRGVTILLVEQNAQVALGLADRGYVIESGEIALSDSGAALLNSEQVRRSYLGMK